MRNSQALVADGPCMSRRPPPSPAAPAGKSAILRWQYSRTNDIGDHMRPVARACLQPDIFDMALNRTGRDVQLHRHFLGRKAERDKTKHLGLSVRKFNRGNGVVVHDNPQLMQYLIILIKRNLSVQFTIVNCMTSALNRDNRLLGPIDLYEYVSDYQNMYLLLFATHSG